MVPMPDLAEEIAQPRQMDAGKCFGAECRAGHLVSNRENSQETGKENKSMVKVLDVEGMMCAKCQAHVQKALEGVAGVTAVEVSLENNTASVTMENEIADEMLANAVTEAGYEVKGCRTA